MKNFISHLFSVLTQYQKSKFEFRKEYLLLQHQIEIEKIALTNNSTYHISEKIFTGILHECGGAITKEFNGEISQYGFPFKTHEENIARGCVVSGYKSLEPDFHDAFKLLVTHGISLIKKENIKST